MKILAMKWRRLGDTILWTSALQALREWSPNAEIDIAFPAHYSALFETDPRFQSTYLLEETLAENLKWLPTLRNRRYDWVLNFHANNRSRLLTYGARGKSKIVHHHSRFPKRFGSDLSVVDLGKVMAANERDLNVVRTLGWKSSTPPTRIHVSEQIKESALNELHKQGWKKKDPLILIGPDASRLAKVWPLENYVALANRLSSRARVAVVVETEAFFEGRAYLKDQLERKAILLLTPRLSSLMGYLSHAFCYVGSDSGIKHLACAIGIPTLTLFGPESIGEWHFYGRPHRYLQKPVSCRDRDPELPAFSWCGASVCPYASHSCMTQIRPDEVAKEVESMIGGNCDDKTAPSPRITPSHAEF